MVQKWLNKKINFSRYVTFFIASIAGVVLICSGCQPIPRSSPTPVPTPAPMPTPAAALTVPSFSFSLPERATFRSLTSQPAGLVVPHHLLAAEIAAQAYARVDPKSVQRIVIISPDHFSQGNGNIHIAAYHTATPYGDVPAAVIPDSLQDIPRFSAEQVLREHGLSLQLPFVARYLPNLPVLMVAVRENAKAAVLVDLAVQLDQPGTLYVLSLDFSHELPAAWAEYHDRAAVAALQEADASQVDHLEIDIRDPLKLFLGVMTRQHSQRFTIFANENVQTLNPAGAYEQVTSYVSGAYYLGQPEPSRGVSVTFTGDVMLDRRVYAEANRHSGLNYPFDKIPRVLTGDDFSVVNLEGPMTKISYHASEHQPDNVKFNFDPAYRAPLRQASIEVFGLANNHTQNMGTPGLIQTRKLLEDVGGLVVGDPRRIVEPIQLTAHRQTVTLYAVYDTQTTDYKNFTQQLRASSSATFTAVLMHWGNEYQQKFSQRQQAIAHGLIDAGVDVVVGSGPHVLQPVEVYKGKAIFYSLGNFIFDQDWSKATQQGAVIGARIEGKEISYYLLPISMLNGQVSVATTTASSTMQFFATTFVGPPGLSDSLRQGKMVLSSQ